MDGIDGIAIAEGMLVWMRYWFASMFGGFLVIRPVRAMIEGEVWWGLLGVLPIVGLVSLAVLLADSFWYYPVVLLMVLVSVTWRVTAVIMARVREQGMLAQDARRHRRAIQCDEKNAAARALLGEVYRKQGRLEEALKEYNTATKLDPHDQDIRGHLKSVERDLRERDGIIPCPRCNQRLDAGVRTCHGCGWSRTVVLGRRDMRAARDVKRALICGGLVTVGVVIASLVFRFSLELSVTLMVAGWLACVVVLFHRVRRDIAE